MFAVIKTGGKQYLVKEGQKLRIEKIEGEIGTKVNLDQVLMVANEDGTDVTLGAPIIAGAKVEADVLKQAKGDKVNVIKYKRKVRYARKRGHRQLFTEVLITKIVA